MSRPRYAYVLEVRARDGRWFLSVDWPAYSNRKVAERRALRLTGKVGNPRYRVRTLTFLTNEMVKD